MKTNQTVNPRISELNSHLANIDEQIKLANTAITSGNLKDYSDAISKLAEYETKYQETNAYLTYDMLKGTAEPIKEAILKYSYDVIKHKENKDKITHKVSSIERVTKDRQIDLLKFCKYAGFGTDWQHTCQKFNQLLCLRAATELKFTPSEIEQISTSYFMEEQAKRINLGETPTSNTQICKMLQTILDELIFDDDGKGNNKLKCNTHDVAYLLMCYTKKGRDTLSIAVAKHDFLRRLVMDVSYRVIKNGKYTLDYQKIKTTIAPTVADTTTNTDAKSTTDTTTNADAKSTTDTTTKKSKKKEKVA